MGVSYDITWEDNIGENINIEFYKGLDSNAVKIFEFKDVISDGEYEFTVPADSNFGEGYKAKIISILDYGTKKDVKLFHVEQFKTEKCFMLNKKDSFLSVN